MYQPIVFLVFYTFVMVYVSKWTIQALSLSLISLMSHSGYELELSNSHPVPFVALEQQTTRTAHGTGTQPRNQSAGDTPRNQIYSTRGPFCVRADGASAPKAEGFWVLGIGLRYCC